MIPPRDIYDLIALILLPILIPLLFYVYYHGACSESGKRWQRQMEIWRQEKRERKARKKMLAYEKRLEKRSRRNKYWPDEWYENYLRTGNQNYLVDGKP